MSPEEIKNDIISDIFLINSINCDQNSVFIYLYTQDDFPGIVLVSWVGAELDLDFFEENIKIIRDDLIYKYEIDYISIRKDHVEVRIYQKKKVLRNVGKIQEYIFIHWTKNIFIKIMKIFPSF